MSDDRTPNDPLEAELRTFRPADVPPGLRARIGDELSPPARRSAPARNPLRWIPAAAAVAACLFATVAVWRVWHTTAERQPIVVAPPAAAPVRFELVTPALAGYRLALSRSPEELDRLLDRHAATSLPSDPRPHVRAGAVTGFRLED